MKPLKYLLIPSLLVLTSSLSLAQSKQDTLKVLFVGNSYIYVSNIPHLVSLISDSTQTKLVTSKSTAGGARLSHHWRGERGLKTKELIQKGDFDIVVLQEQSMGTIEQPDSFLIYSRKFSDFIRKHEGQPYYYETWAREKVPQFQETITAMYSRAVNENGAGLVSVGEAWALAKKHRPEIELYQSDGSHQSPLGAFLAACVFVKALSKEVPEKLPHGYGVLDTNRESVRLVQLDPLDVTFCLKVVDELSR
ncbi:MAG: hypothetical protein ACR2MX_16390 [Cyclobacteriaceae bacterium]